MKKKPCKNIRAKQYKKIDFSEFLTCTIRGVRSRML